MANRHHKRRGDQLPVPVQKRMMRERREDEKSASDDDQATALTVLAEQYRRSRTLGTGEQLPPDIQSEIDKIAEPEDTVLQRILSAAYRYDLARRVGPVTEELPRPIIKNGIPFYWVGHNASHEFYLGVQDGKIYHYSVGEGGPPDKDGVIPADERIQEITESELGTIYIGHY